MPSASSRTRTRVKRARIAHLGDRAARPTRPPERTTRLGRTARASTLLPESFGDDPTSRSARRRRRSARPEVARRPPPSALAPTPSSPGREHGGLGGPLPLRSDPDLQHPRGMPPAGCLPPPTRVPPELPARRLAPRIRRRMFRAIRNAFAAKSRLRDDSRTRDGAPLEHHARPRTPGPSQAPSPGAAAPRWLLRPEGPNSCSATFDLESTRHDERRKKKTRIKRHYFVHKPSTATRTVSPQSFSAHSHKFSTTPIRRRPVRGRRANTIRSALNDAELARSIPFVICV